MSMFLLISE